MAAAVAVRLVVGMSVPHVRAPMQMFAHPFMRMPRHMRMHAPSHTCEHISKACPSAHTIVSTFGHVHSPLRVCT